MRTDWHDTYLIDCLTLGNGKARPLSFGEIPVYGGNGILDFCDSYNYTDKTIVIGRVGAYCGSVYITNDKVWISDNALSAKAKNGYDINFLYYFLINLNLNQYAEGAAQPLLTHSIIYSIETTIPPLPEQRAIASVLSSLDDKIYLLRRQNVTLEAMAQALFRQWFVVEAKDEWEEKTIGDVVEVKGGSTPNTDIPEYWDGDIYWTSPKDLSGSKSVFIFKTGRTITSSGLEKISSGLLPKGTVLLSSRAPIGYLAITEIEVAINQGYIAILDNDIVSNYYMYLWCKSNMEEIIASANGATFLEISKSVFRSLPFLFPPRQLLSNFNGRISPIFDKIRFNQAQIHTLEKLRDTLLPKLMTGEIRVKY